MSMVLPGHGAGWRAEACMSLDFPVAPESPRPAVWRRALTFFHSVFSVRGGRRLADPVLEVLPEFDVEDVLVKLRIRERAVENSRHEIPATQDVQLDGPHALIIQHVEQAIREGKSQLETHLFNLTRRIRAVDVAPAASALAALPARLAYDLDDCLKRHAERVAPFRERHGSLREQLREFRERFAIRNEPHVPASHILHVGLLLVILVCESALNGRYLARADELGLLGGVTNAFVVALLNVSVSFFLGRAAAWLAGARPGFRVLGGLAALAFLVWASLYNLTIAHARDLLGHSIDYDAVLDGIGRMWRAPFAFTDVGSWLLLGLGILFSVLSFADGTRWDDATPGYASLDRRVAEARKDWLHAHGDLEREGDALFQQRRSALLQGADRIRYRVAAVRNDVEQKRLLQAKVRNFFRYAVESCNTMLRIYRDLNRQHRTTAPPAYFQQAWSHPEPELVEVDLAPDERRVKTQEAAWQDLASHREDLLRKLEAVHETFKARTRELGAGDATRLVTAESRADG